MGQSKRSWFVPTHNSIPSEVKDFYEPTEIEKSEIQEKINRKRAWQKEYNDKNRDRFTERKNEISRLWKKNNPERVKQYKRKYRERKRHE